jgi:hypothetical protein
MPIHAGFDKKLKKYFVQYGETGKKYYYDPYSNRSFLEAKLKAQKQSAAIHASQARRK